MADYLPKDGTLLKNWANSFATQVAAAPAEYGLGTAEAEMLTQAADAYHDAFTQATSPQTRTRAAVATKNETRKALLQVVRRYARLIKANPAVGRDLKINLGLTREGPGRTRVAAPASAPVLHVVAATPLRHLLRYSDMAEGNRRGKPAKVIGLQLFCHVGTAAPAHPLDARFERFVTRQPHAVHFQGEQMGLRAFYYARWQTATGETGPWSQVVSMTVAG